MTLTILHILLYFFALVGVGATIIFFVVWYALTGLEKILVPLSKGVSSVISRRYP